MPLTSPTDDPPEPAVGGRLFVVATPIGNMEDITLRALSVLKDVDVIAAEDTRQTRRLLAHHHISGKLISYHEHNEALRTPALVDRLLNGERIALVSDAGTPVVSDPGYRLIRAAVARQVPVVPVPGVSAVTAALSASGLPTDTFVFVGFPAKKKGKRNSWLESLAAEMRTMVMYESPRRIEALLAEVREVMGDRYVVLCREMTKTYEEFLRGKVSAVLDRLGERGQVKGECTLLVSGADPGAVSDGASLEQDIAAALAAGEGPGTISRTLSTRRGLSRKRIYSEALRLKKNSK